MIICLIGSEFIHLRGVEEGWTPPYPLADVCVGEIFKEKCYFMEPWVSTWLPSAAGHRLGRLPRISDFTDGYHQLPALMVPEGLADRGTQVSYTYGQGEPSTAEVMGCGSKPGIKLWFCLLPAQGMTKLILSGQRMPLLCRNCETCRS